jgi:hypothetical protein
MTGTCGGKEVKYKEMDLLTLDILGKGQAPSWFPGAKYGRVILRSSSILLVSVFVTGLHLTVIHFASVHFLSPNHHKFILILLISGPHTDLILT